jgi:phage terminase large subunit
MSDVAEVVAEIPYKPRPQFKPFHYRTQRWAVLVAHRRAGKTVAAVNDAIKGAIRCTSGEGRYAYVAPLYVQAKDIAWGYLKQYARPLLIKSPNESELYVDLFNGSRVRLYGADNPDRMRGGGLDGVIMDEYADMKPAVWGEIIRPMLSDRHGWATFIGTPKGRVGLYDIWKSQGQWKDVELFKLMLKASETGLISKAELEDARRTMSEEEYAQEFECSFEAAVKGAYYGKLMAKLEDEKRITGVPHDTAAQVWTAWDLGKADATAIWFAQVVGREVHIIDYYEMTGAELDHYAKIVMEKPYIYAGHIVPFDAQAKILGMAQTRLEQLEKLLRKMPIVAPMHRVEDGINAARVLLARCWFDRLKCERGIDALKLYRAEFDPKLNTLRPVPVHDWASHGADAFRYLAMALDKSDLSKTDFTRSLNYPPQGVA